MAGQTEAQNEAEITAKLDAEKTKIEKQQGDKSKGFLHGPLAIGAHLLSQPAELEAKVKTELAAREQATKAKVKPEDYEKLATETVNASIASHAAQFKSSHPELTSDDELNAQLQSDLNKHLPGGNKDAAIKHLTTVIATEAQQANTKVQEEAKQLQAEATTATNAAVNPTAAAATTTTTTTTPAPASTTAAAPAAAPATVAA